MTLELQGNLSYFTGWLLSVFSWRAQQRLCHTQRQSKLWKSENLSEIFVRSKGDRVRSIDMIEQCGINKMCSGLTETGIRLLQEKIKNKESEPEHRTYRNQSFKAVSIFHCDLSFSEVNIWVLWCKNSSVFFFKALYNSGWDISSWDAAFALLL